MASWTGWIVENLESAGARAEALARIILARNGLSLRVIPMAWVNMGKGMPGKVELSRGWLGIKRSAGACAALALAPVEGAAWGRSRKGCR
ncbi:MAG TPA: hypothetical protein VF778_04880, partial [Xanthobacteraceae bacterium]